MATNASQRNIETRQQLFDFLQSQMQVTYEGLKEEHRLSFESSLIKTYIFEVNAPAGVDFGEQELLRKFVERVFSPQERRDTIVVVTSKEEEGFFEVNLKYGRREAILYIDASTNKRFWLGFSISGSSTLDWWIETLSQTQTAFDLVWLWPSFLEAVQKRGLPRGFGLDYDYRKFEGDDPEKTTYLKMQLWGGGDTAELYSLLKTNDKFHDKVVLSKIRLKEFSLPSDESLFALQDLKYMGKFTARGTDFSTHATTVNFVRSNYEKQIRAIEDNYALRWRESASKTLSIEGFAMHFVPRGFEIPVDRFHERVLNGATPFRLLGFTRMIDKFSAVSEVVDLHTGGEFSLEIYPDRLIVYLPEHTCGNTIARLYTNLQHFLSVEFVVETDNGDVLF